MQKKYILLLLMIVCLYNFACASEKVTFFPNDITSEISSDLTGYLKRIPKNEGQLLLLNRLLDHKRYQDILLLIKPKFSITEIKKLLENDDLFLMIETLDVLSVNLDLAEPFSDWYFSRLVSLSIKYPSVYLRFLIDFCSKADGIYAEWFADPLLNVIESRCAEFIEALDKSHAQKKICGILKSGDQRRAFELLKNTSDYNTKANSKSLGNLIDCLE